MAKVHLVLQGKGGVGKSVIASLIAQYTMQQGKAPLCIDTDPVNATFEGYKAFNVQRLDILDDNEIDARRFDELIELISTSEQDVIVDNGASSFVPLSHYMITNEVPSILAAMGHEVIVHTVIAGSQSLPDTISGFAQLISQFPIESKFVVWLNPYWGDIEHDGKPFIKMKAYTQNQDRVSDIVALPKLKQETFGRDFSDVLEQRKTFNEAIEDANRTIMVRQRLKITQKQIFDCLDNVSVFA